MSAARMSASAFAGPCAAALLVIVCLLQLLALWRTPALWYPAAITVSLRPGEAVTLGRRELAAPQAHARHLVVRRDSAGGWWVRNVSQGGQLLLQRANGARRMGSAALYERQGFTIGAERFVVASADHAGIVFSGAGHEWRYDGAALSRDASAQPPCPGAGPGARAATFWNHAAPRVLQLARPLTFGGNLHCGTRIGIAAVPSAQASMSMRDHQVLLSAGGGSQYATVRLTRGAHGPHSDAGQFDLAQNEEALSGVSALAVGRTVLAIGLHAGRLQLAPGRNVSLFADTGQPLPAQIAWQWQRRDAWILAAGLAWWTLFGLGAAALAQRRLRPPPANAAPLGAALLGTALLAITGCGALLLQRSGNPPGAGVSMLIGWAALGCCLRCAGRPTLVTGAAALLLAVGLLAQLELGLGAMESAWMRHFQKSAALLALGIGAAAHLRLRLYRRLLEGRAAPPRHRIEWVLAALAAAALAALLAQVLFGDETGVFEVQPVEFAKLALAALSAHCLAVGAGLHDAQAERGGARWFRVAAPALLFIALLGLALVQVDDYSPLILLAVWSVAMALAWSAATRRHAVGAVLTGVVLCAAVAIVAMRGAGAEQLADWGFYGDRFLVWLEPARHPHTGQQLLLGARAITEGAWLGSDQRLGISTLGQPAASALRIPAVQDDFAPAFFINRHGLLGALALWGLQALFLAGLLRAATRALATAALARHFRQAWLGRFRCFALCGGAAFVLGHLLLSWGTNLAIFPVMGQPMSFLSAGGSHLLLFICPLLAFAAVSIQSSEENAPCRSMSNTKS